jgi:1-acyl-sn-glycerol-3-phosphate acyltransferase
MRALLQALFFALVAKPFLRLFIGVRVLARAHLPAREPFLLVANHSSHLDTVALLDLFPLRRLRRIRPVAAADYFERNAAVSWLSHTFFNILPIARRGFTREQNPVEQMRAALAAGQGLLLFPEGTRSTTGEVGEFHVGVAALLEAFPELAVHPVHLRNLGRSLPKGEFLPVPFFCEVRLGPPVRPAGDRREAADALRAAVLALRDGG